MSTNASAPPQEPNVAGVKVRPGVAMALYFLLVASAGLAMWSEQAADAPPVLRQAGPWLFLCFAVGFSAYRLALVMARRYSAFKAFFQVFAAALFFMLLLLPRVQPPPPPGSSTVEPLPALLTERSAATRALAAEVAGWRQDMAQAPRLVALLSDESPDVREAAHAALVRLNQGSDLGPANQPSSIAAWKERFKQ